MADPKQPPPNAEPAPTEDEEKAVELPLEENDLNAQPG